MGRPGRESRRLRARSRPGSPSPTSTRGRCTAAWRWRRSNAAPIPMTPTPWAQSPASIRIDLDDERVALDGRDASEAIRAPRVSEAASRVSVHAAVREAMVDRQRELIAAGRYVAEGRDIGTVVSPEAPLKVFLTASARERARRRAVQTGEDPAAGPRRPGRARRARPDTRAQRPAPGRGRGRDRHHGPRPGAGRRPGRGARPRAEPRVSRLPTIAIVGFPNVGKSTLVNRLAGGREAVTHAEAGRHPRPQAGAL